jgi:hypothetical protein
MGLSVDFAHRVILLNLLKVLQIKIVIIVNIGIVMSLYAQLRSSPNSSVEEIEDCLDGNLFEDIERFVKEELLPMIK